MTGINDLSPRNGAAIDREANRLASFEEHRRLLFAIAYRMLGSVMEAEDVLQEAYLRYRAVPEVEIRSPKAFLTTVVTRLCLDELKSARARRLDYFGPWLPEPVLTTEMDSYYAPGERLEARESISMAFLVLLESLSPVERAVFLLREVFDFTYAEIAVIVGKREDACRQIFHRARHYLDERRPRFRSTPEELARLAQGFLRACEAGDLAGLTQLLANDIILWGDGGGKVAASTRPVHGPDRVARLILGVLRKAPARAALTEVNGGPGILLYLGDHLFWVISLEIGGGRICGIRGILNPDKLRHLRA